MLRTARALLLSLLSIAAALPATALSLLDGPHLFVDREGLRLSTGLTIVQHPPVKTGEMAVVVDQPWERYFLYYNSVVQARGNGAHPTEVPAEFPTLLVRTRRHAGLGIRDQDLLR